MWPEEVSATSQFGTVLIPVDVNPILKIRRRTRILSEALFLKRPLFYLDKEKLQPAKERHHPPQIIR